MTALVARPGNERRTHAAGTCYSFYCYCLPGGRPEPAPPARAYAYVQAHLLACTTEVDLTKGRLTRFATDSGIELAATFVEENQRRREAAFERLFQAVIRDQVEIVIVPSLLHLMVLGSPGHIKGYFEAATGAHVMAMY